MAKFSLCQGSPAELALGKLKATKFTVEGRIDRRDSSRVTPTALLDSLSRLQLHTPGPTLALMAAGWGQPAGEESATWRLGSTKGPPTSMHNPPINLSILHLPFVVALSWPGRGGGGFTLVLQVALKADYQQNVRNSCLSGKKKKIFRDSI